MGIMTNEPGSFDEGLDRLEALVQRLEAGSLGLEEALATYEDGIKLSRALQQQLSEAQRRVEVLKQSLGGEYRAEALEDSSS
jgi:exodeoxyribonuclease VII small subunit